MELQKLRQIGLTDGEIKVYEALIELGSTTKTNLAKKSKISPSNIYDVTNRLLEKGIISKVEKNGVAHFSPANPNQILAFVEKKEKEIENEKRLVKDLIPTLLLKYQEKREENNVEVFYGWDGLKTIFEELIEDCKKEDTNYVFGASKGESEKTADAFFLKYSKLRAEKNIRTYIIFDDELKNRKERINYFIKSKNYDVRFIKETAPSEVMVYKNITCIILLSKVPMTIRVTSDEVAKSFRQYFEILWKNANK